MAHFRHHSLADMADFYMPASADGVRNAAIELARHAGMDPQRISQLSGALD